MRLFTMKLKLNQKLACGSSNIFDFKNIALVCFCFLLITDAFSIEYYTLKIFI